MRHLNLTIEGEIVRAISGGESQGNIPLQLRSEIVYFTNSFCPSARGRSVAPRGVCAGVRRESEICSRNKKGGSVSFYALLSQAPAILSLPVHFSQVSRSGARTGSGSDYDALH